MFYPEICCSMKAALFFSPTDSISSYLAKWPSLVSSRKNYLAKCMGAAVLHWSCKLASDNSCASAIESTSCKAPFCACIICALS